MQNPKFRTIKFSSDEDLEEYMLDCLCWVFGEHMSLELDMPHEDCADF
jgi:hypothetical protein